MEGSIVFWRSTKHCLAEAQKYLCHNLSFLHNQDILQILLLELHTRVILSDYDFKSMFSEDDRTLKLGHQGDFHFRATAFIFIFNPLNSFSFSSIFLFKNQKPRPVEMEEEEEVPPGREDRGNRKTQQSHR